MVAAVAATVVAAGTATALAMNSGNDDPRPKDAAGPASLPASAAPSTPPPPFPTDTILARVDQGADAFPAGDYRIVSFTPGSAERTPLPDTEGHMLPQWSNDRKRFATTRAEGNAGSIWVFDADGGNPEKVVDDATGRVAWSPDDTRIAFMRQVGKVRQMFVITVGESDEKQLTWSDRPKDDPVWSPDGETIAYWRHTENQPQLYLLSADNPKEPGRRLTSGDTGPAVDPTWSPDGETIAYTRITGSGKSDIWLVDADGTDARQFSGHADREMDPDYAPDGSWITFVRGDVARPAIVVRKADGSDERTLTEAPAREGHPGWS